LNKTFWRLGLSMVGAMGLWEKLKLLKLLISMKTRAKNFFLRMITTT
jgi:hypothetical protein